MSRNPEKAGSTPTPTLMCRLEPNTSKLVWGFTLFEIMIVVTIIALIMAIALPNYIEGRRKSRENICISNQKIIYTAAAMYMNSESDSLENMSDAQRLQALVDRGYLRGNQWAECPSSHDQDYNDYIMTFEDGFISDIECTEDSAGHKWP